MNRLDNIYFFKNWRGLSFSCSSLSILIILTLFLLGCTTPNVEVGKVTIVIKEPIQIAKKGDS
ncbi:hypothetical protein OAJ43_02685 [Nitrosomonadales bacterium]|nr:hypothetical protein [Nitrosomonadales bacterium]